MARISPRSHPSGLTEPAGRGENLHGCTVPPVNDGFNAERDGVVTDGFSPGLRRVLRKSAAEALPNSSENRMVN